MYGICEMSVNKHIKGTLCDCKSTEETFKTECHSILTYSDSNIISYSFRFLLTDHFSSSVTKIYCVSVDR